MGDGDNRRILSHVSHQLEARFPQSPLPSAFSFDIFNSTAGPGWYADARRDIIRNPDD